MSHMITGKIIKGDLRRNIKLANSSIPKEDKVTKEGNIPLEGTIKILEAGSINLGWQKGEKEKNILYNSI